MDALTPDRALAYLAELSTDLRAAVVADRDGAVLAGDAWLAAPLGELLSLAGGGGVEVRAPAGTIVAAGGGGHMLAAIAGPGALPELLRHDVATVLGDLAGTAG
jgi:hypothetical protein